MELKHIHTHFRTDRHARFNRTFMELKLFTSFEIEIAITGFNRTFMELKPNNTKFSKTFINVLIGPSWN